MAWYHYTSREHAQGIIAVGALRPGRGGLTYLTDVAYQAGWQAASELAITLKPVELGVALALRGAAATGPHFVQYIRDGSGAILRPGGGREFTVTATIELDQTNWFILDAP